MAYSTASCVAITIVGLVASWIFASLRFYVRMGILKRLNWDDFFAALALVRISITSLFVRTTYSMIVLLYNSRHILSYWQYRSRSW